MRLLWRLDKEMLGQYVGSAGSVTCQPPRCLPRTGEQTLGGAGGLTSFD